MFNFPWSEYLSSSSVLVEATMEWNHFWRSILIFMKYFLGSKYFLLKFPVLHRRNIKSKLWRFLQIFVVFLENLNFKNAPSIIILLHCVVEGSLFGNFLHATITGSFFYDCALLNAKFNYPGTYVPLGSTWLSNQGTLHSGEFHHFFHLL